MRQPLVLRSLSHQGVGRNFGYSAAHKADPLPLLPSGPGGVHGTSLHRARSSIDSSHAQENFRARLLRESSTALLSPDSSPRAIADHRVVALPAPRSLLHWHVQHIPLNASAAS